jgi:hypothetical protein
VFRVVNPANPRLFGRRGTVQLDVACGTLRPPAATERQASARPEHTAPRIFTQEIVTGSTTSPNTA